MGSLEASPTWNMKAVGSYKLKHGTFALELIEIFIKLFASKKRKGYNETGTNILILYVDTTNFP
ncbi:hypothetical protein BK123_19655 [Paenibacillus lautus]|uniref:Uncharacterized protein n=1 Tax=Paenibacillus lautus TaxID=1401 RepID=A0A1R1B033_PAELA|nr:hypothetical protein BK123_19655 [Paenibacillus lautus]